MPESILLIEDQKIVGTLYSEVLEEAGYTVHWLEDGREALNMLKSASPGIDMVITDYHVPGANGMEILHAAQAQREDMPVIFMTAHGSVKTAIEAMRAGAFDYLEKPIDLDNLVVLTQRALSQVPQNTSQEAPPKEASQLIIGRSEQMLNVYKSIGRVAALPATVFIHGETGTGKELIAKTIHKFSKRANEPFIAINCAAIPEALLESELFGHERGAFTGAEKQHIGRFEQANGGTLFLDEIGDMPSALQVKILRVLQERKIQRLGSNKEIPVDVRIVTATHRDLEERIREGHFREDLYHRLCVAEIELPPLRDRKGDIPLLVKHLLTEAAKEYGFKNATIDSAAMQILQGQPWPGNVRQLQNTVRKALLMSRNMTISARNLQDLNLSSHSSQPPKEALQNIPEQAQKNPSQSYSALTANQPEPITEFDLSHWVKEQIDEQPEEKNNLRQDLLDTVDKELITQSLQKYRYNRSKVAERLGITRKTLRARMVLLGIE